MLRPYDGATETLNPSFDSVTMSHERTTSINIHRKIASRSPGHMLPGIAMFLIGSIVFAILAYQSKTNDARLPWDMTIAKTFRDLQVNAPWSTMENLLFGVFLGKEVVVLIGVVWVAYFAHKRLWRELTLTVLGLGGGALLWFLLSQFFHRPGPSDHLDVLPATMSSFPSGPALMAILGYGLLSYLLVPTLRSRFWKWMIAFLCLLAIVVVGLSSLLFGTHYASDVIAGYALGLAWAGIVLLAVERWIETRPVSNAERSQANIYELRVPGFFGGHLGLSVMLILLGILSFAALGYEVRTQGPLTRLDLTVYKALLSAARDASPMVNDIMLFGFFVGKQAVQGIVLLLSLYFLLQRQWLELAILQISTNGGGLLKNLIIDWFARPRPPEQLGLVITELPSFPSGHALGTLICYGFLTYLLIGRMPSLFWKWTLGIGMALLILFEGFSRIFQGNHYLTDVLAADALGIAWLVLVCLVMERVFLRGKGNRGPLIPNRRDTEENN